MRDLPRGGKAAEQRADPAPHPQEHTAPLARPGASRIELTFNEALVPRAVRVTVGKVGAPAKTHPVAVEVVGGNKVVRATPRHPLGPGEYEVEWRAAGAPPAAAPRSLRTMLLIASVLACVLGSVVAIIVSNANSGAPNGTLAREIDKLARTQAELMARADSAAAGS